MEEDLRMEEDHREQHGLTSSNHAEASTTKKPGWKAMPYILGNETIERMASMGASSNLMVYLKEVFHMSQVEAANVITIWSGTCSFLPILGAYIADSFLGKFKTIAFSSFATFLGLVLLVLVTWVPQFHPPHCTNAYKDEHGGSCVPPNSMQFGTLILAFIFLAIGAGGIRPCSIPFAIDQFDLTSEKGKKGAARYYTWYYTTQTIIAVFNTTVLVTIQTHNWVVGFGILAILMACAIIFLFVGTRVYSYLPPQGSLLSGIVQVFVAAFKKRRLKSPKIVEATELDGVFYNPLLTQQNKTLKMPLTKQLPCLNKAALVGEDEVNKEGLAKNPWRLCSIQQVEEVKSLVKLLPVWTACILGSIPMAQSGTFPVSQSTQMNRYIGHFQMPAASINVVSFVTIAIWLPFFDFYLQPVIVKLTKRQPGVTCLQKIVAGNIFGILAMIVAGIVEKKRRSMTTMEGINISVWWLSPQYVLMGLTDVSIIIGQIEFYNGEAPEHMRSIGNSLASLCSAFSSYAGTVVIDIIHAVTRKHGSNDWLNDDINKGRLDYYYFLIAAIVAVNLVYLVTCAKRYRYKAFAKPQPLESP